MESRIICALLILVTLVQLVVSVRPKYQHFDDYLSNLDDEEKTIITQQNLKPKDEDQDSDEDDDTTTTSTTELPLWAGFTKTKDLACCMLGQLAGDKGYHCFSKYYMARLIMRNMNRAHNRKMAFYGREKIPNYGDRVMRTFEQCVAGHATIFHKCCHIASMEVKPRRYDTVQRARYLRKHKTSHVTAE